VSSADPGGVDHVPTSRVVECTDCGGIVTLLPGDIVRKHLDPALGPDIERRDRICKGSRTDHWKEGRHV
jgi:hypothetical protein